MQRLYFIIFTAFIYSCNGHETNKLQAKVDSLEKVVNGIYRPGLGEFMTDIQLHHAKLWFAGINHNWGLADFELKEIGESLDAIQKYCTDRVEVKSIGMILPAIDSITHAIDMKDPAHFNSSFTLLTNTCNSCHEAVKFPFNKIKIPDALPVTNQDFR
jgi:hypothetical protein